MVHSFARIGTRRGNTETRTCVHTRNACTHICMNTRVCHYSLDDRSGKILRNVMRNIANCEDPNPPATIEDEKVVAEIDELFVDVKKQQ